MSIKKTHSHVGLYIIARNKPMNMKTHVINAVHYCVFFISKIMSRPLPYHIYFFYVTVDLLDIMYIFRPTNVLLGMK